MSLMDTAGATTPDTGAKTPPAGAEGTPPVAQPPAGETNDWYYDENIKGAGDKPEWLKDKYKTAADQAKAYSELEKKFGAFTGAPDEYDLTIDGTEIKFSKEDPMLQEFIAKAKEQGVSQAFMTEMLGTYAQALSAHVPNAEVELQKIGANHAQDLQILSQWAGQHLDAGEFNIFKTMVTTADQFKVFDKLRQNSSRAEVAPPNKGTPFETVEQVTKSISDPRYDTDPDFRADVRRRMSIAQANTPKRK